MKYICTTCNYNSDNKSNYEKHLLTAKHISLINNTKKVTVKYICEICNYTSSNKRSYNIHLTTTKHKKRIANKPNESQITPKRLKKKAIPLSLKRNVWNKHIGDVIGKTLCLCCKITDITQMSFACGHIISEFNGGEIKLENLKPICVSCNSSIGTQNMDEFIQNYGL